MEAKFIIGFTGTRNSLTQEQMLALDHAFKITRQVNDGIKRVVLCHGDCVGADAIAHDIFSDEYNTIIYPPRITKNRAFKKAFLLHEEDEYLTRNKKIVDECSVLLACPDNENEEKQRSGTWSTIRHARAQKKKIIIIRPSGKIEVEDNNENNIQ